MKLTLSINLSTTVAVVCRSKEIMKQNSLSFGTMFAIKMADYSLEEQKIFKENMNTIYKTADDIWRQ